MAEEEQHRPEQVLRDDEIVRRAEQSQARGEAKRRLQDRRHAGDGGPRPLHGKRRAGSLARGHAPNRVLPRRHGQEGQIERGAARRIVITGASSGIGEALARYYAAPDTVLGLISRRLAQPALPGTLVPYPLDVSDERALAKAAADFVGHFGAPDLVIANAGIATGTLSEDLSD